MTVCMQMWVLWSSSTFSGLKFYEKVGLYLGEEMKKVLKKIPVITVGMIKTPEVAEKALANGQADFIALGRALLLMRNGPRKRWREGRSHCRSCGEGGHSM